MFFLTGVVALSIDFIMLSTSASLLVTDWLNALLACIVWCDRDPWNPDVICDECSEAPWKAEEAQTVGGSTEARGGPARGIPAPTRSEPEPMPCPTLCRAYEDDDDRRPPTELPCPVPWTCLTVWLAPNCTEEAWRLCIEGAVGEDTGGGTLRLSLSLSLESIDEEEASLRTSLAPRGPTGSIPMGCVGDKRLLESPKGADTPKPTPPGEDLVRPELEEPASPGEAYRVAPAEVVPLGDDRDMCSLFGTGGLVLALELDGEAIVGLVTV